MAISIDWVNKIINVPKADLLLIQIIPMEIRELDIDSFRMELKALEESEAGMTFPDTHSHNPEVSVGGVSLARVVEIINGYTVTFEDGQYAVNLTGANSNIGDRVNVNQVSVRSANSAGLITNTVFEYAVFNGVVSLDSGSPFSGLTYPTGTAQRPVNNISDALAICADQNIEVIHIHGDFVLEQEATGICFESHSFDSGQIEVDNQNIDRCSFSRLTVLGNAAGGHFAMTDCNLPEGFAGLDCHFENCILAGVFVPQSLKTVNGRNCSTPTEAIFDLNGNGHLNLNSFSGVLRVRNVTSLNSLVDVSGNYFLTFENTCTAGNAKVVGIGIFVDDSDGLIVTEKTLPQAVWADDGALAVYSDLAFIRGIEGGRWKIENQEMIFYSEDNLTELIRFELSFDGNGNPNERTRI